MSLLQGAHDWPRLLSLARSQSLEFALATPAWYFRLIPSHDERPALSEIYAKPDDYFEANEVSARCQDEIAEFHDVWRLIAASASLGSLQIALSQRLVHDPDGLMASAPGSQSG